MLPPAVGVVGVQVSGRPGSLSCMDPSSLDVKGERVRVEAAISRYNGSILSRRWLGTTFDARSTTRPR
jgi:hypothetical protein